MSLLVVVNAKYVILLNKNKCLDIFLVSNYHILIL